jgi:hypothetical protein
MKLPLLESYVLKHKPEDMSRYGDSDVQLAALKSNIQVFGVFKDNSYFQTPTPEQHFLLLNLQTQTYADVPDGF